MHTDSNAAVGTTLAAGAGYDITWVLKADGRLMPRGLTRWVTLPPRRTVVKASMCYHGLAILDDGELFQWNNTAYAVMAVAQHAPPPPRPAGVQWLDVSTSELLSLALRSDGGISAWGNSQSASAQIVPALGTNLAYVAIAAGGTHGLALVSDGTVRAWGSNYYGQCNIPVAPAGTAYTGVAAAVRHSLALRSDGQVVFAGDTSLGQDAIPPLPPGMNYLAVSCLAWHSLALRSDGMVVGWGYNNEGQCNVPPLPPGTTYLTVSAGLRHSVALRSDGAVVCWGYSADLEGAVPTLQQNRQFRGAAVGAGHGIALDSAGEIQHWGPDIHGMPNVPPLPTGTTYTNCFAGIINSAALRSDGELVVWGNNTFGQCNVPSLPPGVTYTKAKVSYSRISALRSDGQAVIFGFNNGNTTVPPLPSGQRYVDIHASDNSTFFLRSDGAVLQNHFSSNQILFQPAPTNTSYRKIAVAEFTGFGLRTDGAIASFGIIVPNREPPLPFGVYYVDMACGLTHIAARRSDGTIVAWHSNPALVADYYDPPPLEPGTSYQTVDACWENNIATVGPLSTYITHTAGCAGSRPRTKLVPIDTPKIGETLAIQLDNLPVDLACMTFAWRRLTPAISLGPIGLPGCDAAVLPEATVLLQGSGGRALFQIPIPNSLGLVGLNFHNQAIVFDPQASNPLGLVVSDAAEAVVGH
jgi:alpha-tubulin suppressor-like RCC1 family protein